VELWDNSAITPSCATWDFIATTLVPNALQRDNHAPTVINAHLGRVVVFYLATPLESVTLSSVEPFIHIVLMVIMTSVLLDLSVQMEHAWNHQQPSNHVTQKQIVSLGEDLKPIVCVTTILE